MKKYTLIILASVFTFSCTKIEEKITEQVDRTTEQVKEKAQLAVKETLNETLSNSISSLTNAEDAVFKEVFPAGDSEMITDFKGKKFSFPNGAPAYVFKYKADKALLIPFLEGQPSLDEAKSDQVAKKTDGKSFMEKLSFIEKFIPANTIDMSFLEDFKNDESIEYYKLKRFPNSSTIIYNPKTKQVFHFVEVAKKI